MGDEIKVAPIALRHVESFRACLDAVARERRFLALVEAPPLETLRAFVRASVENDSAQFVALDGERVVGWADVLPSWGHAVSHCGRLGMGVLSGYREQGIGKKLLQACMAKARARGITRTELEVRADNEAAIRLYLGAGFALESRKRNAMRFDGEYHDALQMSLIETNEP
jgi:ribosomal protein S18 acetylase RimI-like enzyme